jgi:glucosamine--fructose-6-phosphate aminotransferase (isomerizing)
MNKQDHETSMMREICEQGAVLARVFRGCRDAIGHYVSRQRGRRVHLVGCGDMYFSALQVESLVPLLWGDPVRAWRSMDLRWFHRFLTSDDVVICASVSGRTPRTLEAALLARRAGAHVLAITDNPNAPLGHEIADVIVLGTSPPELLEQDPYAGYRNIIAQTQTFTATLMVEMALVAGRTASFDADRLVTLTEEWVQTLDREARSLDSFLAGGEQVVVLGSGPHLPAARYGAAKMLEFAVPAAAQCLEEYNHQEVFVADSRTRAILLAGDDESRSRAVELTAAWEQLGVRSLVLAAEGSFAGSSTRHWSLPHAPLLDAVWCEILALQLLTAHGVRAMGRDPSRWLGGRRADTIQAMSAQTIRGSRLWLPD